MSHLSKLFKSICLSTVLCTNFMPICASQQNLSFIEPKAAYTTNITYNTNCNLGGDEIVSTTFMVVADDNTGIINSVTFKNWSISESFGIPFHVSCDLNSLTRINNYQYKASFTVRVKNSWSNEIYAMDSFTVTITSPGSRTINLGESL